MATIGSGSTPRTLADELRSRSDDQLAALLKARPDLVTPVPVDVVQLASRATTRASVMRVFDRLDRFALQVVDAFAVLPEPTTLASIQAVLGAPMSGCEAAINRLQALGIVWGTDDALRLIRVAREILGPFPAGLGPPIQEALGHHQPARLVRMAADLKLEPSGDKETDAAAIAERVVSSLDALLAEVGADAREVLDKLAAGPPTGHIRDATRDLDTASARTPIEELLARALVVPVDSGTVALPREVGLPLRGGILYADVTTEPPPMSTAQHDESAVNHAAGASAIEAVRRLGELLDAWSDSPPPVLRSGGLGVRDLRRLAQRLDVDDATAALLAELGYAAGLVGQSSDFDRVWLPTPDSDGWRRLHPARRWAVLATTWLTTTRVAGLVGSRDQQGRTISALGYDTLRPLAPEVRRTVLDLLAEQPPGAAPEPDDVVDTVRWLRIRRGGRLRDDLVRWTLREAELLGVTGRGAVAAYARLLLVDRLTDDARRAAAAALTESLPAAIDHVLIQADLTAVAPGPLPEDVEHELALVAQLESRGAASVYRFTANSVRRALDAGRTAADVHAFLRRISRTPVPQPLSYLVDDIARRHGKLRVGAAESFLRCDDEAALTRILADPAAVSLKLRRIAPTVLVSDVDTSSLLERLRAMDLMPAVEAADGSVVVARARERRATGGPPAVPQLAEREPPNDAMLHAAVRALRAGDRTSAQRPDLAPGDLGRSVSTEMLAELRRALDTGRPVWIGYVDHHGASTERVVDPVRLEGGWLAAFHHRAGEVRSFAVHRISAVAPVDAT